MLLKYFKLKNFLILLFLFYFIDQDRAQKTEWSISEKITGRVIYSEILGEINGSYYIVKYDKKARQSFKIEKYSHAMLLLKDYQFRVEKDISVERLVILGKNIYVFYTFYDSKQKVFGLFTNVINEDLELKSRDKFLASTKFSIQKDVFIIKKDEWFKGFFIFYPENKNQYETQCRILTLDDQLNELSVEQFSLSNREGDKIDQINVSDSNIIIILKKRVALRNPKDREDVMQVLCYKYGQKKVFGINLYNDSLKFVNAIIKYNALKKSIYIAGFYTDLKSPGLKGTAVLRISRPIDSASFYEVPFESDILTSINGKNSETGITDYYPRSLILRNDGGVILTAEYFSIEREVYSSYYSMSTSYIKNYYQYGDVLILSINPNGTADWSKLIRKEQVSSTDEGYYSSFLTAVLEDKILLLYNDNSKSRMNILCSKINPHGKIDSKVLVTSKDFDGFLVPKIGKQVSENVVIIPGYQRKKGFTLLKVTF
jgi:hypothetical protein